MKIARFDDADYVAASHEDTNKPGVLKKVLFAQADLFPGQVQMVNWSLLPDGESFRPHFHEDMLEVFLLLNGEVEMVVDGSRFAIRRGDAILIEPREIHQMFNRCGQDVEYVVFGVSQETGGKTVVVD